MLRIIKFVLLFTAGYFVGRHIPYGWYIEGGVFLLWLIYCLIRGLEEQRNADHDGGQSI